MKFEVWQLRGSRVVALIAQRLDVVAVAEDGPGLRLLVA